MSKLPKMTWSIATFSPCRLYRYSLTRVWDATKPRVAFICLNPSTADETANDPTVTRCVLYSVAWGAGAFVMLNMFAFRATDPAAMKRQIDPIGDENDRVILAEARRSQFVVAGWGNHGLHRCRSAVVRKLLRDNNIILSCLRQNANGEPAHPLYLPATLTPILMTEVPS